MAMNSKNQIESRLLELQADYTNVILNSKELSQLKSIKNQIQKLNHEMYLQDRQQNIVN